jgi:hypothetical protein
MRPIVFRSITVLAFAAVLIMVKPAAAEDTVMLQPNDRRAGVLTMVGPQGFITRLQVVDADTLAEQVQQLRSELIARKQQLVDEVDEKKLDSGDALLTVLMPGGLLYAGYKKAAYERARNDLAEVSDDISEYSRDLVEIGRRVTPVAIALH